MQYHNSVDFNTPFSIMDEFCRQNIINEPLDLNYKCTLIISNAGEIAGKSMEWHRHLEIVLKLSAKLSISSA